jgi:hypothetical protein
MKNVRFQEIFFIESAFDQGEYKENVCMCQLERGKILG